MNPAAIEGHLKLVLIQWIIIMAAALLLGRLGKRIGQPLAVGEILAGILLGPSFLGLFWPESSLVLFPKETQQSLQLLGKLGLIFLLFQVGMEFDYSHLKTRSKTVVAVSALGIIAPVFCGLAIGPWLHERFAAETPYFGFQLFLCIALSISALPIMGRILLEMKLERTAIGAIGISAAAIDDVIGWILLGVATTLVTSQFNLWQILLQLAGIFIFYIFLQKFAGPWLCKLWRKSSSSNENEMSLSFLAVLLITLFISGLITHLLGIFIIFGAFLLGVALHKETGLVKAWREKFSDLILVAFVPIFFTNTGLNTKIGSLQSEEAWFACGLILLAAVIGKLGGCYLGARLTGLAIREAGCVAALMNTRALMGLIAINIGLELKLLSPELFTMLVLMALVTTAMCGPLLRAWLPSSVRPKISKD